MDRQRTVDLSGMIDLHIHTAPDVRPRLLDDIEAAAQAASSSLRAIVLKSHVTCTADRAAIAQKVVGKVRVLGGLTLNHEVGGLNPAAVEAAIRLGAKVIWMPTISARNVNGQPGTLNVWEKGDVGKLSGQTYEVLELVAKADVALGTGHLSVPEIVSVVKAAREVGIEKIMVTHPDSHLVDMPLEVQQELARMGAYMERCYGNVHPPSPSLSIEEMAHRIRTIGIERTVLSTDFGQVNRPSPVEGLRLFVTGLLKQGFTATEVRIMAAETPAALLGL